MKTILDSDPVEFPETYTVGDWNRLCEEIDAIENSIDASENPK